MSLIKERGSFVSLKDSVKTLQGVGEKRAEQYVKLKIETIYDLITNFPIGYVDCSNLKNIEDIKNGEKAVVRLAIVKKFAAKRVKKMVITKMLAKDEKGVIVEIVYFNNVFLPAKLSVKRAYCFYGAFIVDGFSIKIANPIIVNSLGLIAKYGLTKGLTRNVLVKNLKQAMAKIEEVDDFLPRYLVLKYNLISFKKAIEKIHFPKNVKEYLAARKRLVFQELFFWQLALLRMKKINSVGVEKNEQEVLKSLNLEPFLKELPFKLTAAQKRVIDECVLDCAKKTPMNRLVQGDVGSGKTVVAAAVCYLFAKEKQQVAFMAPTDILAGQHFKTFIDFFKKFKIKIALLVGSLKTKQKREVLNGIKNGEIDVVIGTHAIFQDGVEFNNLKLIITDEQHRFGVKQRERLINKGSFANVLVMSATPIPRTLALIIYGDLKVSTIDELPPNRVAVKTFHITSQKRDKALEFIKKEIAKKRQAFIVCPAIEGDENKLQSVISYEKILQKNGFLKERIGFLHGKMEASLKNEIMEKFLKREIDVLVATTVIEVGVDVANANVILIENAEMFGLSQLHQLRGRVARGSLKAYCILVSNSNSLDNLKRLQVICETTNGFEIAKKDLMLRGPGDFFGIKQHGEINFKIANLKRDLKVAVLSKKEAENMLELDENLEKEENLKIKQKVEKFLTNEITVL